MTLGERVRQGAGHAALQSPTQSGMQPSLEDARCANGESRSCIGPIGGEEVAEMPTWLLVLIIVLVVLALFGGVGYGRR